MRYQWSIWTRSNIILKKAAAAYFTCYRNRVTGLSVENFKASFCRAYKAPADDENKIENVPIPLFFSKALK